MTNRRVEVITSVERRRRWTSAGRNCKGGLRPASKIGGVPIRRGVAPHGGVALGIWSPIKKNRRAGARGMGFTNARQRASLCGQDRWTKRTTPPGSLRRADQWHDEKVWRGASAGLDALLAEANDDPRMVVQWPANTSRLVIRLVRHD
jgi:hypothetical protein